MEPDLEPSMASKAGESSVRHTQEETNKIDPDLILYFEEMHRLMKEEMERDEATKSKKPDTIVEDYNAEEIKIIANEKMLRRRRERFMRHLRRRRKKSKSSQDEESFMSDSDEEMKIPQEEVKRVMEKAIWENMTSTSTATDEVINTNDGDAKRTEKMDIIADDEKMFPRREGRFVRYLRRQRSKSKDSALEIEFQHLQLPMAEESFMSYSSEEMIEETPPQ